MTAAPGDGRAAPPVGPLPEPDAESAFWWDGLREHRILLQQCGACDRPRFPPLPTCPWCASARSHVVASPGRGTVYSFVTAHVPISPGYESALPYTVATVELAEGPRLLGRVEPATAVAVGTAVAPRFADHPRWTELFFAPDRDPGTDPGPNPGPGPDQT